MYCLSPVILPASDEFSRSYIPFDIKEILGGFLGGGGGGPPTAGGERVEEIVRWGWYLPLLVLSC